jgi:hypothetical protein
MAFKDSFFASISLGVVSLEILSYISFKSGAESEQHEKQQKFFIKALLKHGIKQSSAA